MVNTGLTVLSTRDLGLVIVVLGACVSAKEWRFVRFVGQHFMGDFGGGLKSSFLCIRVLVSYGVIALVLQDMVISCKAIEARKSETSTPFLTRL
jgi:hypothetical protein